MTPEQIKNDVLQFEKTDPLAELVAKFIHAGVTEEQLVSSLYRNGVSYVLLIELQNKYRDLTISGWTHNKYGHNWTIGNNHLDN